MDGALLTAAQHIILGLVMIAFILWRDSHASH